MLAPFKTPLYADFEAWRERACSRKWRALLPIFTKCSQDRCLLSIAARQKPQRIAISRDYSQKWHIYLCSDFNLEELTIIDFTEMFSSFMPQQCQRAKICRSQERVAAHTYSYRQQGISPRKLVLLPMAMLNHRFLRRACLLCGVKARSHKPRAVNKYLA